MGSLNSLGKRIAAKRKSLKLTQTELAGRASISRATLDALENGRIGELGFSKITRLLAALGLELTVRVAKARRPTLDQLLEEGRRDEELP